MANFRDLLALAESQITEIDTASTATRIDAGGVVVLVDPIAVSRIIAGRQLERCGAAMPRAGVRCIRRKSHPGPHRAKP